MRMYSPIGGWNDTPLYEVEDYKKKGWICEGEPGYVDGSKPALFRGKEISAEEATPVTVGEPTIEELRVKWQEKHGKKPHHKKTIKTLLAEI